MAGHALRVSISVLVAMAFVTVSPAFASPLLEVESSTDGLGVFTYVVTNATPVAEPGAGVGYIDVPFGTDDGIFAASAPSGWAKIISADNTRFAHIAYDIPNGASRTFTLSSSYFDSTSGLLEAGGISGGSPIVYPTVSVIGPSVPEPIGVAVIVLGTACTLMRRRGRAH